MHADDVFGVVPESTVDLLVRDLEQHGVFPSEIEVRPVTPGRYRLHDEMLHQEARAARRGLLLGGLFGAVAGALVLLSLGGFADPAPAAATLFATAGFGGLVGGVSGLARNDPGDDDPDLYRDLEDDDALQMVAVHCLHWRNRAHRILERHGAVFLDRPDPV